MTIAREGAAPAVLAALLAATFPASAQTAPPPPSPTAPPGAPPADAPPEPPSSPAATPPKAPLTILLRLGVGLGYGAYNEQRPQGTRASAEYANGLAINATLEGAFRLGPAAFLGAGVEFLALPSPSISYKLPPGVSFVNPPDVTPGLGGLFGAVAGLAPRSMPIEGDLLVGFGGYGASGVDGYGGIGPGASVAATYHLAAPDPFALGIQARGTVMLLTGHGPDIGNATGLFPSLVLLATAMYR